MTKPLLVLVMLVGLPAGAQTVTTIRNNGPSSNRLDVVIVGDGYTTKDLSKYVTDVETLVGLFFQQQPYQEYRSYFNVYRIDLASAESGVDHPELGVYKNTALDAKYNCDGIQRLICVDTTKVLNTVSGLLLPSQHDAIIVLVNDTTYGGSGSPEPAIAVVSTNAQSSEIVLHELGHSIGLLADEYETPPGCDTSVEPIEPNVTLATIRETIKWHEWIDPLTPIPTLATAPSVPGLYEGAKYCAQGLYRPTYNSKMRTLGMPFDAVNTEQLIKRYYNWASPIETSNPTDSAVVVLQGQTPTFSVRTLLPTTHSVSVQWNIDGQRVATGTSLLLNSASLALGNHLVSATATDTTAMVRSDPAGILSETARWTLSVLPGCDVNADGTAGVQDVQAIINQALGLAPAGSDLNRDGKVNVVDVQIVINAVLGLGCRL